MSVMMFVKKAVVVTLSLVLIFGTLVLIRNQGKMIAESANQQAGAKESVAN